MTESAPSRLQFITHKTFSEITNSLADLTRRITHIETILRVREPTAESQPVSRGTMPDNGNSSGHVPVMVPARAIKGRLFILGGSANHVTFPGDVRLEDGIYDIRVMAFLHDGRWTNSGSNQSRSLKSPPDEQVPGRNQGPKGLEVPGGEDRRSRLESHPYFLELIERFHTTFGAYMKDREADEIVQDIIPILAKHSGKFLP